MIKIEITKNQEQINTKTGNDKSGRPYTIYEQKAYIHLGGDYPTEFIIPLENAHAYFREGFYQLEPSSFFVGNYGRLTVGRIRLTPFVDGKK